MCRVNRIMQYMISCGWFLSERDVSMAHPCHHVRQHRLVHFHFSLKNSLYYFCLFRASNDKFSQFLFIWEYLKFAFILKDRFNGCGILVDSLSAFWICHSTTFWFLWCLVIYQLLISLTIPSTRWVVFLLLLSGLSFGLQLRQFDYDVFAIGAV